MENREFIDYGYARISTPKQNIERQVRNILAAMPNAHIVKETFTGRSFYGRKDWDKLYKLIIKQAERSKVRLTFDSVSRMSRSADEGCELYEDFFNRGVTMVFLKEPHINSEVYKAAIQKQIDIYISTGNSATDTLLNSIIEALNKFTMDLAKQQIRLAFEQAEKEVQDLHQRTREGIMTARLNGKQIGQMPGKKLNVKKAEPAKEMIRKFNKTFGGQLNNRETWELAKISKMTFYKYKKEILEDIFTEELSLAECER